MRRTMRRTNASPDILGYELTETCLPSKNE
jgi:hypothetical protein